MAKGWKKQFCINGHDTFVCGREKKGGCTECQSQWRTKHKEDSLIYMKEWWKNNTKHLKEYREENKEKRLLQSKEWRQANPELMTELRKQWGNLHKEEILECYRQWIQENPDYQKQWRKEHPEAMKASNIKQQTNRNLRIVSWTDWDNIREFYRNQPEGMTGDHIIPLQGDGVSGLHVSWNLQYLTRSKNSSKGKKIDLLEASEWYGKILKQAGLK